MKKLFLCGSIAVMAAFTSCNDDYSNSVTNAVGAVNLVDYSDGSTSISEGQYGYSLNWGSGYQKGTISVGNLVLNGNPVSFQTEESNYQTSGDFLQAYFTNVGSLQQNLTNAKFLLTPFNYLAYVNNMGEVVSGVSGSDVMIAQYMIGSTRVRTFQKITTFRGQTTTSYEFQGQPYTNETDKILYQLILSFDKETGKVSGKIIMYNAKFSHIKDEPLKTWITIDGLDVNYADGKLTVSGTEIVPTVPDGNNNETENDSFTFNSIVFETTSANLVEAQITYTVDNRYEGSFNGAYAFSDFL